MTTGEVQRRQGWNRPEGTEWTGQAHGMGSRETLVHGAGQGLGEWEPWELCFCFSSRVLSSPGVAKDAACLTLSAGMVNETLRGGYLLCPGQAFP